MVIHPTSPTLSTQLVAPSRDVSCLPTWRAVPPRYLTFFVSFRTRPMRTMLPALLLSAVMPICSAADRKPNRLGELYWLLDRACWTGDELSVQILHKAGADPSGPVTLGL